MPEIGDTSFTHVHATAAPGGMFQLRRGALLLAVNFGEEDAPLDTDGEVVFTTPSALYAGPGPDGLMLPRHAGVLLRERAS